MSTKSISGHLLVLATVTLSLAACGKQEKKEEESVAATQSSLPSLSAVDLTQLGSLPASSAVSLSLQGASERKCDGAHKLGVFSVALGGACDATKGLEELLYGNGDQGKINGVYTCDAFDPKADKNGILYALMCDENVRKAPKLVSYRPLSDTNAMAVSFEDFDAGDATKAVGSWSAVGAALDRYPANMRFWHSKNSSTLHPLLALDLSSEIEGKVDWDGTGMGVTGYVGHATFNAKGDAALCVAQPSEENCLSAHFKLVELNAANAFVSAAEIRILGDKARASSVIIVEGKWHLSAERGQRIAAENPQLDPSFGNTREIYFRTVQKGQQVWGSFDFKDAEGKTIVPVNGSIDLAKIVRDGTGGISYSGVCENFGTQAFADCKDIEYRAFDGVWNGDSAFERFESYPLPQDFSVLPRRGVIFAD